MANEYKDHVDDELPSGIKCTICLGREITIGEYENLGTCVRCYSYRLGWPSKGAEHMLQIVGAVEAEWATS